MPYLSASWVMIHEEALYQVCTFTFSFTRTFLEKIHNDSREILNARNINATNINIHGTQDHEAGN